MIKILHCITGLNVGGAETMLTKVLRNTNTEVYTCTVVCLTGQGPMAAKIRALGVTVYSLDINPSLPNPWKLIQLARFIKQNKFDLIQTWMYHADLVGGVCAWALKIPVIWGIRHGSLDVIESKKTTLLIAKICSYISKYLPCAILCCSQASLQSHKKIGYDERKMIVIPNGFELNDFKPIDGARKSLVEELSLPNESLILGNVGRYNAQKDHQTLLISFSKVSREYPNAFLVLCGDGVDNNNQTLLESCSYLNISEKVFLLGRRNDVARLMSAFDVFVSSSSHGEGFPNVIGESMACGTPCLVTAVGDSALIVGEYGIVSPPKNPEHLALGMRSLIVMSLKERQLLGEKARQRIMNKFNILKIVGEYERLYQKVIS